MTRDEQKFERAIKRLKEEYDRAVKMEFVRKPMAWALYYTWKYYDVKEKDRRETKAGKRGQE